MPKPSKPRTYSRTNRQNILQAVTAITESGRPATPESVREWTGLTAGIVHDHLKTLHFDGELERAARGVYLPMHAQVPLRPLSVTAVAGGAVKLEIGEAVLDLQPGELQMLRFLLAGVGTLPRQIPGADLL